MLFFSLFTFCLPQLVPEIPTPGDFFFVRGRFFTLLFPAILLLLHCYGKIFPLQLKVPRDDNSELINSIRSIKKKETFHADLIKNNDSVGTAQCNVSCMSTLLCVDCQYIRDWSQAGERQLRPAGQQREQLIPAEPARS